MFFKGFEGISSFEVISSKISGITIEVLIKTTYASQSEVLAIWSFCKDAGLMFTCVVEV